MKYKKRNFESIGKLIVPLLKRHGRASIMNYSMLFNIWETLVGENISKKAQPIRMKTIKGGDQNILYLGMTGPYMAELSLQTQDIKEKINSYFSKEVIAQIKLQRIHDAVSRNVVELNKSHNLLSIDHEEPRDSETDIVGLEHALTKMKNNLNHSRKKNEITAD